MLGILGILANMGNLWALWFVAALVIGGLWQARDEWRMRREQKRRAAE